jgi:hypothetical protein
MTALRGPFVFASSHSASGDVDRSVLAFRSADCLKEGRRPAEATSLANNIRREIISR